MGEALREEVTSQCFTAQSLLKRRESFGSGTRHFSGEAKKIWALIESVLKMLEELMTFQFSEKAIGLFLFSICVLAICVGFFGFIEKAMKTRKTIYAVRLKPYQKRTEFFFNILFMGFLSIAFAFLLEFNFIRFAKFNWFDFIFTFLGMIFTFDVIYYFAHRAMHKKTFDFMHARHHWSQVNTPWTAFSLGPFEAFIWIFSIFLFPVLFSSSHRIVGEGVFSYIVFLWTINVWGHCNVETLPRAFASKTLSTFGHPNTYHALHHSRYVKNYSFILTVLDRHFDQVWSDWTAVHERALTGKPMQKLTERVFTDVSRVAEKTESNVTHLEKKQ